MLSTIFLDNDGVLVDTEKYYFEANQETCRTFGYDLSREEYRRLFLSNGSGLGEVAQRLGWPEKKLAEVRVGRDALYYDYVTTRDIAMAGIAEGLERLAGRFGLCIVTSSPRPFFDAIHRRTGFSKFFRQVVSEDGVTNHKPHPEPYLAGLRLMNSTPDQALAIEDSERGLRSALGAGLQCIVIPQELTRNQNFDGATAVEPTFLDAVKVIEQNALYREDPV